jgi:hypothetical protein
MIQYKKKKNDVFLLKKGFLLQKEKKKMIHKRRRKYQRKVQNFFSRNFIFFNIHHIHLGKEVVDVVVVDFAVSSSSFLVVVDFLSYETYLQLRLH